MKKGIFIFLCFATVAVLMSFCAAETTVKTSGDYEYYLADDGTAIIKRYTGSAKKLCIPALLDGHPVTGFDDRAYDDYISSPEAFECYDSITSLSFPEGMKYIGDGAFSDCDNLTEVTIPAGVAFVGEDAFFNCKKLRRVLLPDTLPLMREIVFGECPALSEIVHYDKPAGADRFPSNQIWTQEALRNYLGTDPSSYVSAAPEKNVCLLAIRNKKTSTEEELGRYVVRTMKEMIQSSKGSLSFTADPDEASVLLLLDIDYAMAGTYTVAGNNTRCVAFNCEADLYARDTSALTAITNVHLYTRLGNTIMVFGGETQIWAAFYPDLQPYEMLGFVKRILSHEAAK